MRIDIIKIGNSRGVRIPRAVLEELGFTNSVDMRIENGKLVLERPQARCGWEEAFACAAAEEDEPLLVPDHSLTRFDEDEWEW